MLNPDIKFAKSKGIDLPILYGYLVGKISGNYGTMFGMAETNN